MKARHENLADNCSVDGQAEPATRSMVIAKDQLIRVFLGDHTGTHDFWDKAIILNADIGMFRVLLDNRFPGQQDRRRAHRSGESC